MAVSMVGRVRSGRVLVLMEAACGGTGQPGRRPHPRRLCRLDRMAGDGPLTVVTGGQQTVGDGREALRQAGSDTVLLIYAAMDGWRRQMVQHGRELLGQTLDLARNTRDRVTALPGLHVLRDELLGVEASHELDELKIIIDVSELGISGYQAADWLRVHRSINMGLSDHRRIEAQLSIADTTATTDTLVNGLGELVKSAHTLPSPPRVRLPVVDDLELVTVMLPRDAFFARTEDVPVAQAVRRVCAEQVTPYPPGIPVLLPGERIAEPALEYLRTGLRSGMVIPDAADPALDTIRVVA